MASERGSYPWIQRRYALYEEGLASPHQSISESDEDPLAEPKAHFRALFQEKAGLTPNQLRKYPRVRESVNDVSDQIELVAQQSDDLYIEVKRSASLISDGLAPNVRTALVSAYRDVLFLHAQAREQLNEAMIEGHAELLQERIAISEIQFPTRPPSLIKRAVNRLTNFRGQNPRFPFPF